MTRFTFMARLNELRDRVSKGSGELPRGVRSAAASGASVPAEAQPYTEKVRRHAYQVVDEDIAELRATGWSEDQIFELTVATALNAGLSRWNRASRVLAEAKD